MIPNDAKPLQRIGRSDLWRNVVVRQVCDRSGRKIGMVVENYDGTEDGAIRAAQRATDRMYAEYPEASNIESCIGATDTTGKPKWSISPNLVHIAEIGTDDAFYIRGNVTSGYSEDLPHIQTHRISKDNDSGY